MIVLIAMLQAVVEAPRPREERTFLPYRACVLAAVGNAPDVHRRIGEIEKDARAACVRERSRIELDIAAGDAISLAMTDNKETNSPFYRYDAPKHLREMDKSLSKDIASFVRNARSAHVPSAAN